VLAVFRHRWIWWPILTAARLLRATGIPRTLAGPSPTRFNLAMLAATQPPASPHRRGGLPVRPPTNQARTVMLFRGCVMDRFFGHVHEATERTLVAIGYTVVKPTLPHCCGALHQHAGDRASAMALARANLAEVDPVDFIVVNSAGCGAMLKDYGHLLETDQAKVFAAKVRDISQLLAAAGPRVGGRLDITIAYDAPCHLQHAQGVQAEALAVLTAIEGARIEMLPGFDRCCGSAGIYSILQPAMSRAVLDAKIESIARANPPPDVVATGNPGCLMQIGGGLLAAGLNIPVAHPVELLDRSYQLAGVYQSMG
jgi:glycolate oxidase iron-sulfur subunit